MKKNNINKDSKKKNRVNKDSKPEIDPKEIYVLLKTDGDGVFYVFDSMFMNTEELEDAESYLMKTYPDPYKQKYIFIGKVSLRLGDIYVLETKIVSI